MRTSSRDRHGILVTCDDADARQICDVCLRHAGYDVLTVDEPDLVLDAARRLRPDLIITSYPTRSSSGRTLTETIRADAALAATPILSLSAWVRAEELARAHDTGVTETLPMPVSLNALIGAVKRLIGSPPPVTDPRRSGTPPGADPAAR